MKRNKLQILTLIVMSLLLADATTLFPPRWGISPFSSLHLAPSTNLKVVEPNLDALYQEWRSRGLTNNYALITPDDAIISYFVDRFKEEPEVRNGQIVVLSLDFRDGDFVKGISEGLVKFVPEVTDLGNAPYDFYSALINWAKPYNLDGKEIVIFIKNPHRLDAQNLVSLRALAHEARVTLVTHFVVEHLADLKSEKNYGSAFANIFVSLPTKTEEEINLLDRIREEVASTLLKGTTMRINLVGARRSGKTTMIDKLAYYGFGEIPYFDLQSYPSRNDFPQLEKQILSFVEEHPGKPIFIDEAEIIKLYFDLWLPLDQLLTSKGVKVVYASATPLQQLLEERIVALHVIEIPYPPVEKIVPKSGSIGQHPVGESDFNESELRQLITDAKQKIKQGKLRQATKEDFQGWAGAIETLSNPSANERCKVIFDSLPGLQQEITNLIEVLRAPPRNLTLYFSSGEIDPFQTEPDPQTNERRTTRAFAVREGERITIYIQNPAGDLSGLIHEGLEHWVFPVTRPNQNTHNQYHTLAFFSEGLAGGVIRSVRVVHGSTLFELRDQRVVIPSRVIAQITTQPHLFDRLGNGIWDALDQISRKFPDRSAEHIYANAVARALLQAPAFLEAPIEPVDLLMAEQSLATFLRGELWPKMTQGLSKEAILQDVDRILLDYPNLSQDQKESLRQRVTRVVDSILTAKDHNIILEFSRERLRDREVNFVEAIVDVIRNIPSGILQKPRTPTRIDITKVHDRHVLGRADIGHSIGEVEMALTQHEGLEGEIDELSLAVTVVHEILHKLATMTNQIGTDLVFPIADWIQFLKSRDIKAVVWFGREIPIGEFLSLQNGLEVVKQRIIELRRTQLIYSSGAEPALQPHILTNPKARRYFGDPHEAVAWIGTGQGESYYLSVEPSLTILERNLLRVSQTVYRFNPQTSQWQERRVGQPAGENGFPPISIFESEGVPPLGLPSFIEDELPISQQSAPTPQQIVTYLGGEDRSGGVLKTKVIGDVWIKAASHYYHLRVEGDQVVFQRCNLSKEPVGDLYYFRLDHEFTVGRLPSYIDENGEVRRVDYFFNSDDFLSGRNAHFRFKLSKSQDGSLFLVVNDLKSKYGTGVEWFQPPLDDDEGGRPQNNRKVDLRLNLSL